MTRSLCCAQGRRNQYDYHLYGIIIKFNRKILTAIEFYQILSELSTVLLRDKASIYIVKITRKYTGVQYRCCTTMPTLCLVENSVTGGEKMTKHRRDRHGNFISRVREIETKTMLTPIQ